MVVEVCDTPSLELLREEQGFHQIGDQAHEPGEARCTGAPGELQGRKGSTRFEDQASPGGAQQGAGTRLQETGGLPRLGPDRLRGELVCRRAPHGEGLDLDPHGA